MEFRMFVTKYKTICLIRLVTMGISYGKRLSMGERMRNNPSVFCVVMETFVLDSLRMNSQV